MTAAVAAAEGPDYLREIKPLLMDKCTRCHGTKAPQATLRLDSRSGAVTGGDSGPAIVPGTSADSLLMHAVTGTNGVSKMPPEGPALSAEQVELLKRWIDAGAVAPTDEVVAPLEVVQSEHWAFQPIRRPPVPSLPEVTHPIDAFIRQRLAIENLTPSPPAPKHTLLRRVALDLLGLPPSPTMITEFLADNEPSAYERLVDRLLASPHFGERWGRDWLDAARYADSNGYTRDMPRTIWKYRDWVIEALNANQPFDEFTIDQIAGDLRPQPTLEQLVATGFHRNTLINEEGGTDPEQFRVEAVVDRVNTTGSVFLGLTVGCAQCHDHKYDPISQREYYQLFAVYNSTSFIPGDQAAPRIDVPTRDQLARNEPAKKIEIQAAIARLDEELKASAETIQTAQDAWEKTLTEEDKKALPFNVKNAVDLPPRDRSDVHKRDLTAHFKATTTAREQFPQLDEIARLRKQEPQFVSTMVVSEEAMPRETFVMIRGDFLRTGAPVQPGAPAVLPAIKASGDRASRLDFAHWLVSPENPLTARVIVNRVWQRYFGRGLVETENDFGVQGDRPTHPELLDWLADEFIRTGWDLKNLHRLIVTSETYRQSSVHRDDLDEVDPLNKLLGRQNRLRIDAESIRDAALEVSGLLAEEIGGVPVTPPQPDGVFDFTQDKKPWKDAEGASRYRRALYTQLLRSSLYPGLTVFDFPDPNVTCTRRNRSNTPLQALTLANDKTFTEFAAGLAQRLMSEPGDDSSRLRTAVISTLGREPQSLEAARLRQFLQQQREAFAAHPEDAETVVKSWIEKPSAITEAAAWTAVARALLNLDEFITRE
ncbi:MAG TPA: PSD1 and planctomycete cytochrome C domain-containing protein [Planctomycetaceae bacterium]|nr:PSD1 and planctomycete cytochrome C domain-containing protein [Planctomycetaceae bacterium]